MSQETNNKVIDAKAFKENKKAKKDNAIDEVIAKLVLLHKSTDDQLKEISEMCCSKDMEKDGR